MAGFNRPLTVAVTAPEAIALDLNSGKIYWTDVTDDAIKRANLDGSNVETLIGENMAEASLGLALDAASDKMYWTDHAYRKIYESDLNGNNSKTLLAAMLIRKLVTDVASETLFWTDSGNNMILKSSRDGSSIDTLLAGSNPRGIALDERDHKVYWTELTDKTICRSNLDGSNRETLLSTLSSPIDVELDLIERKLYWLEFQNIKRADMITGSNVETIVAGISYNINDLALDVIEQKIYWIGAGMIERASFDGSSRDTCVTDIPTTTLRTSGIALDLCARKMYWTQCSTGEDKVRRCNLDGTNIEDVLRGFLHHLVAPQSVALALGHATPQITSYDPTILDASNCLPSCNVRFAVNAQDGYSNIVFVALERRLGETWIMEDVEPTPTLPCTLSCEFNEHYTDGAHEFRAVFSCCDGSRVASSSVFVEADRGVPVLISGFEAERLEDGVLLRWRISEGTGLQGFNIYRSLKQDAGFERVNGQLIPADNENEYVDETASRGNTYWYRLGAVADDGEWMSQTISITVPKPELALHQNHPNPFNPTTTISFTLPERARVTLSIYDVEGRLVKTLIDETVGEGYQERSWDGKDTSGSQVGSGVYFYRLTAGTRTLTKKMVLLR